MFVYPLCSPDRRPVSLPGLCFVQPGFYVLISQGEVPSKQRRAAETQLLEDLGWDIIRVEKPAAKRWSWNPPPRMPSNHRTPRWGKKRPKLDGSRSCQ